MADRPPPPARRQAFGLGRLISLPALITIVVCLLLLAGLALLPGVLWQVNPVLWRQLLRLQAATGGLVVGLVIGFLTGRLTARRR
ncbi:MAG: hypothetical protein VKP70_10285 [Cyanobacteriota bacterium]|nr:hypothetical protein [Cyanobacteriota bacterium]